MIRWGTIRRIGTASKSLVDFIRPQRAQNWVFVDLYIFSIMVIEQECRMRSLKSSATVKRNVDARHWKKHNRFSTGGARRFVMTASIGPLYTRKLPEVVWNSCRSDVGRGDSFCIESCPHQGICISGPIKTAMSWPQRVCKSEGAAQSVIESCGHYGRTMAVAMATAMRNADISMDFQLVAA